MDLIRRSLGLALTLHVVAQTASPALRVQSDLRDIRMKAIASLPEAGGSPSDRDGCPWRVIQPKSAGARLVAAQGWAVMADLPLGAYRAVSFAGQMEASTSGTCNITQGNVAVFDGDKLVALAYGKSADDTAIGTLADMRTAFSYCANSGSAALTAGASRIQGCSSPWQY